MSASLSHPLFAAALTLSAWAGLPIQSWTAKTGARVLFVESRSIPMLDIAVDFDAGGRRAPAWQQRQDQPVNRL